MVRFFLGVTVKLPVVYATERGRCLSHSVIVFCIVRYYGDLIFLGRERLSSLRTSDVLTSK